MISLVALYGVGDCYLVCSLARAFERHHSVEAEVVVKSAHKFIPEWFGLKHVVDDEVVRSGESNAGMQLNYANDGKDYSTIYVHPHFVRTPARLDQLTIKPRVSQAAMYRALMQLPPDAPMEKPKGLNLMLTGDIVIITQSRSWPNIGEPFWGALCAELIEDGRALAVNNSTWSLEELLRRCASAREIIGPQCGVMSVLLEAGIGGHKTFAIRDLSDSPYLFGLTQTMPYGHVSTFAGNDHKNVDHVVVPADWRWSVDYIVEGCRRGWLANGDI